MNVLVSEIFKSIQGESSHAGRVCAFVRLSECNMACAWCDTRHAWADGRPLAVGEVIRRVRRLHSPLVEITGGEPLMQEAVFPLMNGLLKAGLEVLLETNGSLSLSRVPDRVTVIMDVKCPSSGMAARNNLRNLKSLRKGDEVKFVVADNRDLRFTDSIIRQYGLDKRFTVNISPVAGKMAADRLARWCVQSGLNLRLNLQLHKIVWPSRTRGV